MFFVLGKHISGRFDLMIILKIVKILESESDYILEMDYSDIYKK